MAKILLCSLAELIAKIPTCLGQTKRAGGQNYLLMADSTANLPSGVFHHREVAADFSGLAVATSGSTGVPKTVILPAQSLIAAAEANQNFFGCSGTWHLALPVHYVAGLMVLVRSWAAGKPVRIVDTKLENLCPAPGENFISLVPAQLFNALSSPTISAKLAQFTAVLLGGGWASAELLNRAKEAKINVVTTYGMSETCGGVIYDGVALPNVDFTIGQDQRIEITTPTVFAGYLDQPELSAEVLRGQTFLTQDRGEIANGKLRLLGRIDDIVKSGGVKVDLAEIQRRVELISQSQHAGVATCAVGIPDEKWSTKVVLVTEGETDLATWRKLLAEPLPKITDTSSASQPTQLSETGLPKQWLPQEVIRVRQVALTSTGKFDRAKNIDLALANRKAANG